MNDRSVTQEREYRRLLHEPLIHFFLLGALLFAASHFLGDEQREVVVTPGLKAFLDKHGRPPSPAEDDEALDRQSYREARGYSTRPQTKRWRSLTIAICRGNRVASS